MLRRYWSAIAVLAMFLFSQTTRPAWAADSVRQGTRTAGNSDIYAAVEQSAVDKVVRDAVYPITLIDAWYPFGGDIEAHDQVLSGAEVKSALEKAKSTDCKTHYQELECRVLQAHVERTQRIEDVRRAKNELIKGGGTWKGPTDKELDALEQGDFPVKLHLAHLKINLLRPPAISISGTTTSINGVSIAVDAIGEVWVEYPAWICTKTCSIGPITICCEGHFESRWFKLAEVPVNDVRIAVDGAITLTVDGLVVYGVPSVSKLVLDYPILRDINLAWFANQALAGQRLAIIDASKLVAALPYINTNYAIQTISVSGNGEIRADITIKKVP
jgi:hypothetical protein